MEMVWSILLDNGETGAKCAVKMTDKKLCERLYSSENSTSNLILHLAGFHQITENTKVEGKLICLIHFLYCFIVKKLINWRLYF